MLYLNHISVVCIEAGKYNRSIQSRQYTFAGSSNKIDSVMTIFSFIMSRYYTTYRFVKEYIVRNNFTWGKHSKIIFFFFLCSCSNDNETNETSSTEAFQYLGLKDIANVSKAEEAVFRDFGVPYRSKIQIIDNYIYVTTLTGVYRKHISTTNNTDWELFAFKDLPIIQFVKNGNKILAISGCADERAFLYSSDNGETYKSITPGSFILKENEYKVIPYSILVEQREWLREQKLREKRCSENGPFK